MRQHLAGNLHTMQLRYAVLCDYANVTSEGKLNLCGIFDRLFSHEFPAIHRELYLVTSLETDPEDEETERSVTIQLIDADGLNLAELNGHMNFGRGKQVINQLHRFCDLRFAIPGSYQFVIRFDDRTVKTLDLEVHAVEDSHVA